MEDVEKVKEVKETAYIEGTLVILGNQKYNLVKKGRAQADQIINLTRWLAKYGGKIASALTGEDGKINMSTIGNALTNLADSLTAESLLDLFTIVTGCTQKSAEDHFDIDLLVESAITTYNNQTSIKRLIERFFSRGNSKSNTEESSTPSEVPTDGQTVQS